MARSSQGKKKTPVRGGGTDRNAQSPSGSKRAVGEQLFPFDFRVPLIVLALVVVTLVTLWPMALNKFVNYDDAVWVTDNPRVQQGLSLANIGWAFTQAYGYWTPIDVLSHMLDCQLFGLNPAGHHVVNLLIHVCNAVLLFLFLRGATSRPWCGALVAGLFALHPLNVEPVAWITSRKDVLSTFWGFLALLAYAKYAANVGRESFPTHRGRWRWYAAVAVLFVLSLMTKPAFLPFPVALLLLDYWPLRRFEGVEFTSRAGRKRVLALLLEKAPFLCIAIAFMVLDYVTQKHFGAVATKESGLMFRVASAAHSYLMYLWKTVWPAVLATPYSRRVPIALWKTAATIAFLGAITGCAVVFRKRCPYLLTGWLWYGLILLPVCGLLVTIGDFAMADRYAYLSMIGPFCVVAYDLGDIARRGRTAATITVGVSVVALLAFAGVARSQVPYWHDDETLFRHAVSVGQKSGAAFNNLSLCASGRGQTEAAKNLLLQALEVDPEYVPTLNNLGKIEMEQGRLEDAKAHLAKALELKPNYVPALSNMGKVEMDEGHFDEAKGHLMKALAVDPQDVHALNTLALLAMGQGRFEEAEAPLKKALERDPRDLGTLDNLGVLAMDLHRPDEAKRYLMKALQIKPQDGPALNNLGTLALNQGRFDEAKDYLTKALEQNSRNAYALNNLGWCFMQQNQYEGAQHYLRQALEVDPKFINALNNLGNVLAKLGRQEEANGYLAKAAELNQASSGAGAGKK